MKLNRQWQSMATFLVAGMLTFVGAAPGQTPPAEHQQADGATGAQTPERSSGKQNPPDGTEEYISPYRPKASGGFSHRWVAYVTEPASDQPDKQLYVELNGRRLGPYDSVSRLFRLSKDGDHIAFAALKGGEWTIVADGRPRWTHKDIGFATFSWSSDMEGHSFTNQSSAANLTFSSDGQKIAYIVKNSDGKWAVAVNGMPGPFFKDVGSDVNFAGSSVTYAAWPDAGIVRVFGDSVLGPYDETYRIQLAGEHSCLIAKKGGEILIVDGRDAAHAPEFGGCAVSGTGAVAYTYRKSAGAGWSLSFGGSDVRGVFDEVSYLTMSDDGKHVAVWARTGSHWNVVTETSEFPGFDGYYFYDFGAKKYSILWGPDGKHIAFWARKGNRGIFAVDGVERTQPRLDRGIVMTVYTDNQGNHVGEASFGGGIEPAAFVQTAVSGLDTKDTPFSPTLIGDELAYAQPAKDGWNMVIGARTEGPYRKVEGGIVAPDSGRHYAYVISDETGQRLVVDGEPRGQHYDAIYRAAFAADGRQVAALAVRADRIYRITIPLK